MGGVALRLPVYHVLEPEIKEQVGPDVLKEHLALMEMALDVGKIAGTLNKIRDAVT